MLDHNPEDYTKSQSYYISKILELEKKQKDIEDRAIMRVIQRLQSTEFTSIILKSVDVNYEKDKADAQKDIQQNREQIKLLQSQIEEVHKELQQITKSIEAIHDQYDVVHNNIEEVEDAIISLHPEMSDKLRRLPGGYPIPKLSQQIYQETIDSLKAGETITDSCGQFSYDFDSKCLHLQFFRKPDYERKTRILVPQKWWCKYNKESNTHIWISRPLTKDNSRFLIETARYLCRHFGWR